MVRPDPSPEREPMSSHQNPETSRVGDTESKVWRETHTDGKRVRSLHSEVREPGTDGEQSQGRERRKGRGRGREKKREREREPMDGQSPLVCLGGQHPERYPLLMGSGREPPIQGRNVCKREPETERD